MVRAVDRSGLPAKFKAWTYQHGIPPRTLWQLLVYEVPNLSKGEGQQPSKMALIPESLSNTVLHGWHNNLQLPLESLVEDLKSVVLQYND